LLSTELLDTAKDVADRLQLDTHNPRSPILLSVSVDDSGAISRVRRLRHDDSPRGKNSIDKDNEP
jgi:hypothetical protein